MTAKKGPAAGFFCAVRLVFTGVSANLCHIKIQGGFYFMGLSEEKTAMQGRFSDWLAEGRLPDVADGGAFECTAGSYHITVIRVRKNRDFDYLYCQRQYHGAGIERGDKFDYAGIYCKRDGLFYDGQYDVRELSDNGRSAEVLREELKQAVRRAVEADVGNDRNNLRVTELSDERERENMTYFQKHTAPGSARAAYLSGEYEDGGDFAFTFRCHYNPDNWTEESLLAYILDPAQYAAAEATVEADSHQEDMLSDFLRADMVAAEYAVILENPLNPVHRVKRIMAAVGATSAKTVNVTICKDDVEFTVKAEAGQFRRDCGSNYSDWHIVAADRREFERRFGNHAHYGPEDILRIEYARSVLYHAQEVTV
jgi:hypothetical protein